MEDEIVASCSHYISEAGIEVLAFNFRGVQQSEGKYDGGRGERDDTLAAIDHLLKLIVFAEHDRYTDELAMRAWLQSVSQPLETCFVPGVGHLFDDRVDTVGRKVAEFLSTNLSSSDQTKL